MTPQQKTPKLTAAKPGIMSRILMALNGMSWAYGTADDVHNALAEQCDKALTELTEIHAEGAAALGNPYAFQPHLIALHGELFGTWSYLRALAERAQELGDSTLAAKLGAATDPVLEALDSVATAAAATIPH
ncbi:MULTISPECIES: hypothetical protein [unclassified Streptomyces]|uniref:hypothetical protein n=1 Tax=unclassified Streptomyces TaxID=2593676 RepID=UPI0033B450AA